MKNETKSRARVCFWEDRSESGEGKKKKEKALIFESVVLQAFSINSVQFNSVAQSLSSV